MWNNFLVTNISQMSCRSTNIESLKNYSNRVPIGCQFSVLGANQRPWPPSWTLESLLLTIVWPMQLKYKISDLKFIFFYLAILFFVYLNISGRVGWSYGADNNPSYIEFYWNAFDRFSMLRTIFVLETSIGTSGFERRTSVYANSAIWSYNNWIAVLFQ